METEQNLFKSHKDFDEDEIETLINSFVVVHPNRKKQNNTPQQSKSPNSSNPAIADARKTKQNSKPSIPEEKTNVFQDEDADWVYVPNKATQYEETSGNLNCSLPSSTHRKFRVRQVILEESKLIIFPSQKEKKRSGVSQKVLGLLNCQISSGYYDTKKERTFKLIDTTSGCVRVYYFQTATLKEYNEWVWKIKWNIEHCQRNKKFISNLFFSKINNLPTNYTCSSQTLSQPKRTGSDNNSGASDTEEDKLATWQRLVQKSKSWMGRHPQTDNNNNNNLHQLSNSNIDGKGEINYKKNETGRNISSSSISKLPIQSMEELELNHNNNNIISSSDVDNEGNDITVEQIVDMDPYIEANDINQRPKLMSKEEFSVVERKFIANLQKLPKSDAADTLFPHIESLILLTEHEVAEIIRMQIQQWKDREYFFICSISPQSLAKFVEDFNAFKSEITERLLMCYPEIRKVVYLTKRLHLVVEDLLIQQIYSLVFNAYKRCFEEVDVQFHHKFIELSEISICNIGLPPSLWLSKEKEGYDKAIELLRGITKLTTFNSKLKLLCNLSSVISSCVSNYNKNAIIAGDDLLPLFAYIIIKAAVPNVHTECKLMEDFISYERSMGETGYFLVTFRTALILISSSSAPPKHDRQENSNWLSAQSSSLNFSFECEDNNNSIDPVSYDGDHDDRDELDFFTETDTNMNNGGGDNNNHHSSGDGKLYNNNNNGRTSPPSSFFLWASSRLNSNGNSSGNISFT